MSRNKKFSANTLALGVGIAATAAVLTTAHANAEEIQQPPVANVTVLGATCDTPYVEVSGVTKDGDSVTLTTQNEDGSYSVVDNDSVEVRLDGVVQQTVRAHAITKPGTQFVMRTLAHNNAQQQFRLVVSGLDDSVVGPFVDVRFNSSTEGCPHD